MQHDLDFVFIDSHYNEEDEFETQKFNTELEKLWKFADETTPFDLKDIKAALNEIAEKHQEIENLSEKLAQHCNEVDDSSKIVVDNAGFSSGQFGGFGFGMFILGILFTGLVLFYLSKQSEKQPVIIE